jgi:hypothetical protein
MCLPRSRSNERVLGMAAHLAREGVAMIDGPGERAGATGPIMSVYLNEPDGNLVEVSTTL